MYEFGQHIGTARGVVHAQSWRDRDGGVTGTVCGRRFITVDLWGRAERDLSCKGCAAELRCPRGHDECPTYSLCELITHNRRVSALS